MADKKYVVLVQFDTRNVYVTAKNKREAGRKVKEHLKTVQAYRFLDKRNFFVDER